MVGFLDFVDSTMPTEGRLLSPYEFRSPRVTPGKGGEFFADDKRGPNELSVEAMLEQSPPAPARSVQGAS